VRRDEGAIGHHLNGAFQIGAMDGQARHLGEVLEGDGMWMAVVVIGPARDDGDPRLQDGQHFRGGARFRAVVSDLEHVDPSEQAALQQLPLHRRLRITGQQGPEATAL
jgi:hypothetical protein